jgi:translation elongation factor EF-G
VKDYLRLWSEGWPRQESILLESPLSVIGVQKSLFPRAEFAKIKLTVHPANAFEVSDNVEEKRDLEELGVGWPDCVIFGLLDVLMLADTGPLYKVRVVLEEVWYHEVDSTWQAFRHAGRDAGRQIIESIGQR